MASAYPHRAEFRLKILALLLDARFSRMFGNIIRPEFFETDAEQDVVTAILTYKEQFNKIPNDLTDVAELCTDPGALDVLYDVYELVHADLDMAQQVAVQWAKEQATKSAILECVDDIKRGNLAAIIPKMEQALRVGDNMLSPGLDVVDDVDMWLDEGWTDRIPTGLLHLDAHLEGGLSIGELGVILAPTNVGKSTALMNVAFGAAGLVHGKNVTIITHELRPKKYAKRFGARLTFRFPDKHGNLDAYKEEFIDAARMLMPGNVKIVGGNRMTTNEISDIVHKLADEGHHTDLLIDDYADFILPPKNYSERRFELTAVYEWLRRFGDDEGSPIWTASQVGRSAYSREIIRLQDVAEDIGKVNTADVVLALCQTNEELRKNRCRLYLAKARDAERGKLWDAKLFSKAQALLTIGEAEMRENADA